MSQTPGHLPASCTLVGELENAAYTESGPDALRGAALSRWKEARRAGWKHPSSPRQAAWVVSGLSLVWMELNLSGGLFTPDPK